MSDTHGADIAAEPNDGLTPEERQQFDAMRGDPAELETGATPAPDPAAAPPPVVAQEQQPESPAEDDDEDDEQPAAGADPAAPKPKPRRVNYAKFERAETARIKAETDLAQAREAQARLDERVRLINEAMAVQPGAQQAVQHQQQVDNDPEPDKEADIYAHNDWLARQLGRLVNVVNDMQQGRHQETTDNALTDAYRQDSLTFAQREPHFWPAYDFLMQSRTKEVALYRFGKNLMTPGVTLTPKEFQQVNAVIAGEERAIVAAAMQQGTSPASSIFQLAQLRGFAPAAAVAQPAPDTVAQPAPRAPAPAPAAGTTPPPAAATPSVVDEIARIKSGSEAALSLSNGGGSPARTQLTPQQLADMPQDQFNALMESLSPDEQRRAMGG